MTADESGARGALDARGLGALPHQSDPQVVCEGGWWPPGDGEPGSDWTYEKADLRLLMADDGDEVIDVQQVTPDGDRALVAIPLSALAALLVQRWAPDA